MIAAAMHAGIVKAGDVAVIREAHNYRSPEAEVAVFYGFDRNLRKAYADYRAAELPVVYIDLGYWGRHHGGTLEGYHKVSVNDRHPTAYFQKTRHTEARFAALGVPIRPWRQGTSILLAGMSAKSAESEGFAPQQWEQLTLGMLRQFTDRPIIYRPKPSWREAAPLDGASYEPGLDDLGRLLEDCHAVVTHHSNVAIDGLLAGIPAFCVKGAALPMALNDLTKIEEPYRPLDRAQWAADLAWSQFTPAEMRSGFVWNHLKDEGLIP